MQYFKRNTKFSILAFLVLILSITISISTLANTEVYFSLSDNLQILSPTSLKPEVQTINTSPSSQDGFLNIFQISEPLTQKIIDLPFMSFPLPFMSFPLPFMSFPRKRESIILRDELGGFKEPQDLTQLPKITNLDWKEWAEEEIAISIQ